MKLNEMLDKMVELAESGNSECLNMTIAIKNKLTPVYTKGDIVYIECDEPEDEQKVVYYMFDSIQDEMKYYIENDEEYNYSEDELILIRKAGQ